MSNKALTWILFIFLSLTWGSSFILMKKGMYPGEKNDLVFGPFQLGAWRIILAGTALLPLAIKFRKYLTKKNVGLLLVSGLFGNFIPAMMFTLAETNIDSSLAGLLNMSTTFFVVLIGIFFYKSKPSKWQLLGLAIGSTGLYLVLSQQFNAAEMKDPRYAFFIFPATLGYAISLTTIKFKLQHMPSTAITSLSFLLILVPAIIAGIVTKAYEPFMQHELAWKGFGYIAILSIVGTAIAVMLFTKLIAISNHIFSSAIAYMLPVVAILIGLADGEKFALINLLYVVLIILGVFLMSKANSKKQKVNKIEEEQVVAEV
ncbi:DMT family transporter [Paracrocinitomix mangrovi]|uniref:DMT family transporter n=1 Tax=Paracrocinitomix mangrovi TaxID=2862509 RepID=UPI001C8EA4DC|nr:DMT family transporter [Paracrocinitomix mangrovi]UKN03438.1 DMT family transporter [Paracrocinitomix mangrovi]